MQNIHYSVKPVASLVANQTAATVNGTGIDRLGYDDIELVVANGAATGTPTSYSIDVKLQESDDNSTFTDITGAAITQITANNTLRNIKVGNAYLKKRYIRTVTVVAFVGGTTPAVATAVEVLLGLPQVQPAV